MWNTDLADHACLKHALSKALGLGIVLGGSIVKVPQIIKIVSSRSARGLSLSSYLLDTASTAIAVAYNARNGFAFSTYGELVFLLAQNVVIIALIVLYKPGKSLPTLATVGALLAASGYALSSPSLVSPGTLQLLQASSIPLALAAKLPQIASNFRLGSTGQLSAFLVLNSLLGTLARVFTTSQETGDSLLWWGFASTAALNAVIALQMVRYWNKVGGASPAAVSQGGRQRELEKEIYEKKQSLVGAGGAASTPAKRSVSGAGKTASPKVGSPVVTPKRYVRKLD